MIHRVPGDPATIMLGPRATPELREALRLRLGLDEPFVVQVGSFFLSVLTGDLGIDIVRDQPVSDIVLRQLPYSFPLVLCSFRLPTLFVLPLACFSAILPPLLSSSSFFLLFLFFFFFFFLSLLSPFLYFFSFFFFFFFFFF